MDWQPIESAPSKTRVLVADDKGHVQISRRVPVRWHDDSDALIDPPSWWMPLPDAPAEQADRKAPKHKR